jgi:hypothetical protein
MDIEGVADVEAQVRLIHDEVIPAASRPRRLTRVLTSAINLHAPPT